MKTRKLLSIALVMAMIASMFTFMTVSAADSLPVLEIKDYEPVATVNYASERLDIDLKFDETKNEIDEDIDVSIMYCIGKNTGAVTGAKAKWLPMVGSTTKGRISIADYIPKKGFAYMSVQYFDNQKFKLVGNPTIVTIDSRPDGKTLKSVANALYSGGIFKNQQPEDLWIGVGGKGIASYFDLSGKIYVDAYLTNWNKTHASATTDDKAAEQKKAESFKELKMSPDYFPFGAVGTLSLLGYNTWSKWAAGDVYEGEKLVAGNTNDDKVIGTDKAITGGQFESSTMKFKIPAQPKAPNVSKFAITAGKADKKAGTQAPSFIKGTNEKMEVFVGYALIDNPDFDKDEDEDEDNPKKIPDYEKEVWGTLAKNITVPDFLKLFSGAQNTYVVVESDYVKGDDVANPKVEFKAATEYNYTVRFSDTGKKPSSARAEYVLAAKDVPAVTAVVAGTDTTIEVSTAKDINITVTLTNGKYSTDIAKGDFTVAGTGVAMKDIVRTSDTVVTVTVTVSNATSTTATVSKIAAEKIINLAGTPVGEVVPTGTPVKADIPAATTTAP